METHIEVSTYFARRLGALSGCYDREMSNGLMHRIVLKAL